MGYSGGLWGMDLYGTMRGLLQVMGAVSGTGLMRSQQINRSLWWLIRRGYWCHGGVIFLVIVTGGFSRGHVAKGGWGCRDTVALCCLNFVSLSPKLVTRELLR